MFTVPDQNDAVATCPAFSPVGPTPQGFFADCNPGQNFPGTRPIAEHFNELILNLHALLTKASVAPVKADPTMLWRAILNLPMITQPLTLNVSTSGVAKPANPWAGDPFNNVANALAFLYPYWIVPPSGSVTIQIAAGTYQHAASLLIEHPFAQGITLLGAGAGATILVFTDCDGIRCHGSALYAIRNLTVRGTGTTTYKRGVIITGGPASFLDNITVEQFTGIGIWIEQGHVVLQNTVTCNDNGGFGLYCGNAQCAAEAGSTLVANRNAGDANVAFITANGSLQALQTTGGKRGLWVNGSAAVNVVSMSIGSVSLGTEAVLATTQGALLYSTNPVANSWTVAAGQSFKADQMGLIMGNVCLATANRPQCSPAINVIGNIDSYIQAI